MCQASVITGNDTIIVRGRNAPVYTQTLLAIRYGGRSGNAPLRPFRDMKTAKDRTLIEVWQRLISSQSQTWIRADDPHRKPLGRAVVAQAGRRCVNIQAGSEGIHDP